MYVAKRIKKLRTSLGMSGNQLAKKAGIGQSTLSDIENGKVSPSVDTLELICSALGITLADFFADDSDMSLDMMMLLRAASDLTNEQRKQLALFIETVVRGKLTGD